MKKLKKLQLLVAILGLTAAAAGFSVMDTSSVQVKAEEESVFAMDDGAAVRAVKDEAGIRWETSVNKAWYDEVVSGLKEGQTITNYSFGTFVTSANNVSSVTELDENFTNEVKDLPCKVTPDFASETTFTYYSSIVYNNMNEWTEAERKEAYATELIARSYMKYSTDGGETYTYEYATATDSARCMRAVALAAYEETDPEKVLTAAQKEVVNDYFSAEKTAIELEDYYQTAVNTVNGDYTVAYAGAKKVGTVSEGTLTLDKAYLGETLALTFFDADGNYAKSNESQYITKFVTNDSFKTDLAGSDKVTALAGYFLLTEDVTLSGTWKSFVTFSGTLDGNGKTISGLSVGNTNTGSGHSGGLFYQTAGATIKNVAIVDATLSYTAGALAGRNEAGTLTVDNVYVSLAPQAFSENGDGTVVDKANHHKGGLVYNNRLDASDIIVKNSIVYMPEHLVKLSGLVAARQQNKGSVTVENSMLIGGNGAIVGRNDTTGAVSGETCITDAVSAHKTINEKAEADVTFVEKAYQANHPYVELNGANFVNGFKSSTSQSIIVLTEDIDFAAAEGEEGYVVNGSSFYAKSTKAFSGVFDGQNHKISNIKAETSAIKNGGLFFNTFYGSFKNVEFINCRVGSGSCNCGIITNEIPGSTMAYFDNIVMDVTHLRSSAGLVSPIARIVEGAFCMKDVVVYCHSGDITAYATTTFIGALTTATTTILMDNCYYINEWETTEVEFVYVGSTKYQQDATAIAKFFWDSEENDDGLTSYLTMEAFKAAFNAEDSTMYLTQLACDSLGLTYRGKSQA